MPEWCTRWYTGWWSVVGSTRGMGTGLWYIPGGVPVVWVRVWCLTVVYRVWLSGHCFGCLATVLPGFGCLVTVLPVFLAVLPLFGCTGHGLAYWPRFGCTGTAGLPGGTAGLPGGLPDCQAEA